MRRQTLVMVDIRDAEAMVAALRDARRRFEKGAPVPYAAAALLRGIADALADSGPLELGVTLESWVEALISVDQGVASLDVDWSSKTTREVKRSLRELQSFFARNEARQELLWNCAGAAFIVLITASLALFHRDPVVTVGWLTLLGFVGAALFVLRRYRPDAPRLALRLDLPDRPLFAHVVDAPRWVSSGVRAQLGMYVHPVLIATDRRLILVRAKWEHLGRSSGRGLRILWELPYTDLRSFSSRSVGEKHPKTVVIVKAADREISHTLSAAGGKALVAILKRRAPAALSKPIPPPRRAGSSRCARRMVGRADARVKAERFELSMGKRPHYVPPIRIGSGGGSGLRPQPPLIVLSGLIATPVGAGTLAAYLFRHGHPAGGTVSAFLSLMAVVQLVIDGPRAWLAARVRWPPIVVIGITGAVLLVAVGWWAVISPGGSSSSHQASFDTVGRLSAGKCFDPTGAATSCGSSALFKLVKCSDVEAVDRQVVAIAESDFPDLKRLANRAAVQDLCLTSTAG